MKIIKTFGKRSPMWDESETVNEFFLQNTKDLFDTILQSVGFVILRDVYNTLGIEATRESCIYGWTKKEFNEIKMETFKSDRENEFKCVFDCNSIIDSLKSEEGE